MPRRMFCLALIALLLTAACAPTPPTQAPPATIGLLGNVKLDYPTDGGTLYSEVIFASGTANAVPNNTFTLDVVNADDAVIASSTIQVNADGTWQAELPQPYNGDPAEFNIVARPTDNSAQSAYAVNTVTIAALQHRPEGALGSISAPIEGGTAGGESFIVDGMASGVPQNTITVTLLDTNNAVISSAIVTLQNPYYVDVLGWQTELTTQGYQGLATLEISFSSPMDGSVTTLDSISLNIGSAAG
jgi:hypothetical protein